MASPKVHILAVFANPRGTDPLRLEAEERAITMSIRLAKNRNRISKDVLRAATIDDLRRHLLEHPSQYRILHIAGHGGEDGLVFATENHEPYIVPMKPLAALFSKYSPPLECVLLNACNTRSQADLASLGVPFTISMEGPLSDNAGISFAKGCDIKRAYEEGCQTVALDVPDAEFDPSFVRSSKAMVKLFGSKLAEGNSENRKQVALEVASLHKDEAIELLEQRWSNEVDPTVRHFIALALGRIRSDLAVKTLIKLQMLELDNFARLGISEALKLVDGSISKEANF
jgi:hypothetical protein